MFKKCPKCGKEWSERDHFLNDPEVALIGYQPYFEKLVLGLFLFNHSCGTTMGIEAGLFRDLYTGPVFADNIMGTEECAGYCLIQRNLSPCSAKCEGAYIREIMQIIKGEAEAVC